MFEVAGEFYYFDLDNLSDVVRLEVKPPLNPIEEVLGGDDEVGGEETQFFTDPTQMIDITKWEMLKGLIESILNENATTDNKMGIKGLESELSLPAKLAFNTLLKYKILNNE